MLASVFKSFTNITAEAESSAETLYAPNSDIPFKPTLIKELKSENRTILSAVKQLMDRIKQDNIEASHQMMVEIKKAMLDHFAKENVSLYVYITSLIEGDDDKEHVVSELKREMDGVQSMMFLFFSTYMNIELEKEDLYAMGQELSVISKVLSWRIKREEKELYPLYVAPPGV